jgi:hypothetical protein
MRYHLRKAFKAAGSEWRGFYAFRRGLASELFARGAEDLDVSHVLRHSKVIVTRDSYIKRFDSRVLDAMNTLAVKTPRTKNKGPARDHEDTTKRLAKRRSRVKTSDWPQWARSSIGKSIGFLISSTGWFSDWLSAQSPLFSTLLWSRFGTVYLR